MAAEAGSRYDVLQDVRHKDAMDVMSIARLHIQLSPTFMSALI